MRARKPRSDPMDDLMRWRRSWPDGGNGPDYDSDEARQQRQKLRAMLQHEKLLANVRDYCGIGPGTNTKAPRDVKNYLRWQAVVEARREGLQQRPKETWQNAYTKASQRLAGGPAAGTPRTMKEAYQSVERIRRQATKVGQKRPS
jgi:hypothetical protein